MRQFFKLILVVLSFVFRPITTEYKKTFCMTEEEENENFERQRREYLREQRQGR